MEYSRRIKKLRAELCLTQHDLAVLLHVRAQVVASWEQGRKEPSASSYQQLANLAPPKEAWFFLEQIGVTKKLVREKWPGRVSARPSNSPRARVRTTNRSDNRFLQIPLLRDKLPAAPHEITEREIASVIAVPTKFVRKKAGAYAAIRNRGDSMAPVLKDKFIVVVDRTNRDPARLTGRMVGVWGEEGPLVRWLNRESATGQLILRPENTQHPTLVFDASAAERILGDVVFWWGSQE